MLYKDIIEFRVLPYTLSGHCCIIYGNKGSLPIDILRIFGKTLRYII